MKIEKVENHVPSNCMVFEEGEVWTLDVVVSTGQGKVHEYFIVLYSLEKKVVQSLF